MDRPLDDRSIHILLADDDEEDRMLTLDAFRESRIHNPIHCVEDGEELLDYLRRKGRYADPAASPRPAMILLDLNMPRLDGRQALEIIKNDPDLRTIPVIVLTTSKAEEDLLRTYELGGNAFIVKPVSFDGLVEAMRALGNFWFQVVGLPTSGG